MVWNIVSPRREGRIILLTGRGRCSEKWKKLPEEVRSAPSIAALREYDKESVRNRNLMKARHLRNLHSTRNIGEQTEKP
jgi:hypothetical protein